MDCGAVVDSILRLSPDSYCKYM